MQASGDFDQRVSLWSGVNTSIGAQVWGSHEGDLKVHGSESSTQEVPREWLLPRWRVRDAGGKEGGGHVGNQLYSEQLWEGVGHLQAKDLGGTLCGLSMKGVLRLSWVFWGRPFQTQRGRGFLALQVTFTIVERQWAVTEGKDSHTWAVTGGGDTLILGCDRRMVQSYMGSEGEGTPRTRV